MRKTITTAAATAAALLLAGCGSSTTSLRGPAAEPGGPVAVSDGEDIYRQLLDDVYGTSADRIIGEKYQHHRTQTAIADCMKDKGVVYPIPAYDGIAGAPIVPGDVDGAAPLSADFAIATGLRQHAEGVAKNAALNPDALNKDEKPGAYDEALTACSPLADQFMGTHFPEGTEQYGQLILNNLKLMIVATEEYQDRLADYRDCLRESGHPVESWAKLHAAAREKFPPNGTAWPALATAPGWAEAVAYEKTAAAADRRCRTDLHEYTMAEMGARAERMRREGNGGAVKQITDGWDKLLADAAAAGIR